MRSHTSGHSSFIHIHETVMLTEGTFQASNKRGHLSHGMDFQGTYAGQEQAKK